MTIRLFDTDIYFHWSSGFFLFLALKMTYSITGWSMESLIAAAALSFSIFASVLAHEFAHIFAAKQLKCATGKILFFFLGAVSEIDSRCSPKTMALISAAGPLVSILIAIPFAALYQVLDAGTLLWQWSLIIFCINIFGALNIIPIPPLDGGRVLKGFLEHKYPKSRAKISKYMRYYSYVAGGIIMAGGLVLSLLSSGMILLLGLTIIACGLYIVYVAHKERWL